ncbi:MAG: hypothetical protein Q7T29_02340 [Gallionella sp.]|nr:hypothetical protein [Gallionella sp.]
MKRANCNKVRQSASSQRLAKMQAIHCPASWAWSRRGGVVSWMGALLLALACSGEAVAAVTYQARGAAISGTGAVTPAWPAHAINDIALLFVESTGGQPVTLSTPAGFAAVANSPQATGAGTAGTQITVFWARATSAAMTSPTVADPGDHVYARILTYRGAITAGNPWDVTGGGVKAVASTSVTVTGVTTTVANTRIVQAVARDDDSTAAAFSAETNVNLTGIAERNDAGTTSGNGGGFAVWDGGLAAAGATGNTTATVTSSINAFLTIALIPQPAALLTRFYMQNAAPDFATVTTHRGLWDSTAAVLQRKLSRTKSGAIASKGVAEASATNNYDVLLLKLVSEPITTAQTIAGTLNWVAGSLESAGGMNAHWHVHAYVTVGDTDTLRGTLVNNYTEALGTNEWPATAVGDGPVAPLTLTPVTIFANDRIVIEAGYVARNTSTASRTGTLWYGGTNATDLALNGDETTLPGWWEFNSVLFPVAVAPDHIQIDHDGIGQTCRAETLTVKACADAACTTYFTGSDVTGNITWAGAPGGSIPFTITGGGTGQTTVLLPVTTAQTVTLGTSSVAPLPTNVSTCTNASGGAACSIIFSSASACFDAVEVGAISTPLFTKLSGTAFSLDVLAASTYSGTLQVELVNSSTGSCATYASLNTQSTTFTSQTRKTLNFNYANAAKDVKVRITGLAASSCSSGRFAIRPQSLTVTSSANADATGTSTSAIPRVIAGTAFTLNADTSIAGYDGTPVIDNTLVLAHAAAVANGAVSGVFGAANPATGVATGSSFDYNEAGYFKMDTEGVYDDTFTAVDSAAGDCTNDFSNTLVGGKYGCKFGNTAASNFFGRFIPDHFDTAITEVTPAAGGTEAVCADGFTYSAQPFIAQVSAKNSAGTVTQNYDTTAGYSKAVTLSDGNAVAGGALTNTALAATAFLAGVGNTPDPTSAASPRYTFTVAQTAPATIRLRATESAGGDSVSSATGTEDTMEIRSGRLVLGNAHGSELLGLTIPITTQFWMAGGFYTTNTGDDCTMIPASSIVMSSYTKNLAACETQLSPTGDMTFVNGVLPAPLNLSAPGNGNDGSVNLLVNVGSVAAGNTCIGAIESAATAANAPWLATNTRRATFGVYKGANEFIFLRENY